MIHVFHGFLGSPEDFVFLSQEGVTLHDLCELVTYPTVGPHDILIGYSMGGRIALEIANQNQYKIKRLLLLNSHPGLATEEERVARKGFEDSILINLQTQSHSEFQAFWNNLPLFKNDSPIIVDESRYQKNIELFNRYRLSNQIDHMPHLIKNTDKVLYIAGLHDEKYMELATEVLLQNDITVKGINGGHRLFQNPEELKQLLQDEGII